MKRLTLLVGAILIAGLPLVSGQDSAPAIVFESLTKDFGQVVEGDDLKHVFTFRNEGQGTLEIKKVQPT